MKKITILISCILIAMAIGVFCIAWTYPGKTAGAPGPGFFPMILATILFVLSVILLLDTRKEKDEPLHLFTKKNAVVLLSLVITVAYVIMMRITGFPLATLLYLFGVMLFFRVKDWKTLILVPVLTTGIVYGVFTHFLSVQFPRGILF